MHQLPTELSDPCYHDDEAARVTLESIRWPDGPFCPYCGSLDTVKPTPTPPKARGGGWFHCRACRKRFTVRVGSIFHRSHAPLHKWLLAFRLMLGSKKGFSAHQLHRTLNVDYKTAWFMEHRIRECMEPRKEEFRAWLGWPRGNALVIIARLEFHGSHPGWHCHSMCCDIAGIDPAQPLHRQFVRLPNAAAPHRKMDFVSSEAAALVMAFRFYRVTGTPPGQLL